MINVIGLGYIGLPTALMLAKNGLDVTGTDINPTTIKSLNKDRITFKESGLEELFKEAVTNGIEFACEYQIADYYIISVPTPYDSLTRRVDASCVVDAVSRVLDVCPEGAVVIIESTISPGTVDKYIRPVVDESGKQIYLAHAPERIIPGNMISELVNNPRTIGVDDQETGYKIKQIYESFCKGEIIITDIRTAEMTKVVENTFRDINIAYANELAKICRIADMDVYEIIRIANMHPRVNILNPGPGVGGHCISVDPWFLVGDYPGLANIILAARKINDSMPEFVLDRIREIMDKHGISDVGKVGLYGLTYKENVDDIRESPSLQLLESMKRHLCGDLIKAYDPYVRDNIVNNQYHDFCKFINDIDLLVIMVGHDEIINNMNLLSDKIILDTRNICKSDGVYRL